jgi:hypothetical protein
MRLSEDCVWPTLIAMSASEQKTLHFILLLHYLIDKYPNYY